MTVDAALSFRFSNNQTHNHFFSLRFGGTCVSSCPVMALSYCSVRKFSDVPLCHDLYICTSSSFMNDLFFPDDFDGLPVRFCDGHFFLLDSRAWKA